jgi:protein required for attachment to host cells
VGSSLDRPQRADIVPRFVDRRRRIAMAQANIWVATFDEAGCRVFSFNGAPRRLEELSGERRMGPHKASFPDRPGRVHSSVGERRSAMSPRTDPERRLETAFIDELAADLAAKAEAGAFDRLIVAASPRALGAFRAAASKPLAAKIVREVNKSYVNGDLARLRAALEQ